MPVSAPPKWTDIKQKPNTVSGFGITDMASQSVASASAVAWSGVSGKPSTVSGYGITDASQLGVGQSWQDVTGSRVSGTTYTNSTGRPIEVTAGGQAVSGSPQMTVVVNGVTIISWNFPYGTGQPVTFIVPNGKTYSITFGAGTTMNRWEELR